MSALLYVCGFLAFLIGVLATNSYGAIAFSSGLVCLLWLCCAGWICDRLAGIEKQTKRVADTLERAFPEKVTEHIESKPQEETPAERRARLAKLHRDPEIAEYLERKRMERH